MLLSKSLAKAHGWHTDQFEKVYTVYTVLYNRALLLLFLMLFGEAIPRELHKQALLSHNMLFMFCRTLLQPSFFLMQAACEHSLLVIEKKQFNTECQPNKTVFQLKPTMWQQRKK